MRGGCFRYPLFTVTISPIIRCSVNNCYAIHRPAFEKYTFESTHALLPQSAGLGLDFRLPKSCGWQHGELTTENLAMAPMMYSISWAMVSDAPVMHEMNPHNLFLINLVWRLLVHSLGGEKTSTSKGTDVVILDSKYSILKWVMTVTKICLSLDLPR